MTTFFVILALVVVQVGALAMVRRAQRFSRIRDRIRRHIRSELPLLVIQGFRSDHLEALDRAMVNSITWDISLLRHFPLTATEAAEAEIPWLLLRKDYDSHIQEQLEVLREEIIEDLERSNYLKY